MKHKFKIIKARAKDARAIHEVFYEAWTTTFPRERAGATAIDEFQQTFTNETIERKSKRIANLPENEKILLALAGNKVVGLCRGIKYHDCNQLRAICVLPAYQRQGVGSMLWNELVKFFDYSKDIIVNVEVTNKKAIGFYKKMGFKYTGRQFPEESLRIKSDFIIPEKQFILDVQNMRHNS